MTTYPVTATRVGDWWALEAIVPQASVHSQTRRLDQVEDTAREAVALALDAPLDSFELSIDIQVPDDIRARVDSVTELAHLASELQSLAVQVRRSLAADLHSLGYSVRDSGSLLGISSQRISQLIAEHRQNTDSISPSVDVFVAFDERWHAVVSPLVESARIQRSDVLPARESVG